ncbi:MAG: hypothetical protein VZR09_11885 [Candidatus Gastranaerophilaceae bacterium]|nr:hypothetical protein [Candidatus Gastranaerophilaceae bacterium]
MTHSYQYISSLPHTRRKLNARFVHQLKKLCSGKFGIHVCEVFNDDEFGDYAYIFVTNNTIAAVILAAVKSLCSRYGIGSDYIEIFDGFKGDMDEIEGQYMHIYLSKKKPYHD